MSGGRSGSSAQRTDLSEETAQLRPETRSLSAVQVPSRVALSTRGEVVERRSTGAGAPTTVLTLRTSDAVPQTRGGASGVRPATLPTTGVRIRCARPTTRPVGGVQLSYLDVLFDFVHVYCILLKLRAPFPRNFFPKFVVRFGPAGPHQ